MKETIISTKKFILKYGLILGVIGGIYFCIRFATDNIYTINWFYSSIEIILYISLIYPIYRYKSLNKGILKVSEAIKIGIGISLIAYSLSLLYNRILIDIIQSEYIIQTLNETKQEALINNPNISPGDIQETIKANRKYYSFTVFMVNLMIGFVVSLIAGAILRKKKL
ncbi:DUF4199 domain-containing protein [Aquimarina mytili]|uniref:DUF4199 domain-containing protein n=1 Tax=Aquimarina mytili TaxID=874423 RepID=A0A937D7N0_9FLAO|nr:DUF4199 domain-containing protein [Aquimarina mytili]MBL0685704.1 DUF4199 domain-containing protein [Aquimarina mytili]